MSQLDPRRAGRITGSRIGAILGLNPYSTRGDVLREMVREAHGAEREFQGNEATRYGEAHEPDALAAYEAREGVMTYGGGELLIHPVHDFLAVTPDGLVGDDGMIECKAPFRGTYTHWNEKPYYEAQMRLQVECAVRAWCDFVVWRDGEIAVSRIERDAAWLQSVLPVLEQFMADYRAAMEAPESYLADTIRDDKPWRDAASDYLDTLAAFNDIERMVKAKRERLIELAGGTSAKGCGVQVIRSERAGSVAYAKAVKELLPDADLSPYTGEPTTFFTVKESNR